MRIEKYIQQMKAVVLSTAFVCLVISGCKKDEEDPATTPTTSNSPVGNWQCSEVIRHQPATNPFIVHIVNGTGDTLLMENFYALGFDKKAKLKLTNDSLNFYYLPQSVSPGIVVTKGHGKLSGTTSITMFYIVNDGTTIDTVDATFTRQ